ncbi:MAG: hypothetical protein LBG10_05815, partial [Treponema sp.]|nr:hypothetical protein [Treponema sp.]
PPQTPPPDETPAAPDGPSQAALNDLNAAIARAEEARKRASDFESGSYFPSDWENAESEYAAAGRLPKDTDDTARQAASRYTALADTYDGIFKRAIPLYARDREDEIVALRDEVLETGLSNTFPDYLLGADRTAAQALTQYEEADYYGALDSWTSALSRYQALKAGGAAYNTRQEIVNRDFISYDPDNFNKADESGLAAVESYQAERIEAAREQAEEAGLRYHRVLNTAWAAHVAERRLAADAERQKALDFKANVAVKTEFDAASAIYNQAGLSAQAENYTEAVRLYSQSEAQFIVVGRTAEIKRQEAEQALQEAEQKILESEENAKQAELILEGGES